MGISVPWKARFWNGMFVDYRVPDSAHEPNPRAAANVNCNYWSGGGHLEQPVLDCQGSHMMIVI